MNSEKRKKLPLPLAGLILGQLGLGNLLGIYHPYLRYGCAVLAVVLLACLVRSLVCNWQAYRADLDNPAILSTLATFPMSLLLLSGYMPTLPLMAGFGFLLWWCGFLLDVGLIAYFTVRFVFGYKKAFLTPSWTVLYVGLATASLTVAVTGERWLAQGILFYALLVSLPLFALIFEKYRRQALERELRAQIVILAAPLSLLLASSCQLWGKEAWSIYLMGLFILSQSVYVFALSKLPEILRTPFHPSWSALTFPLVISALAFRLTYQTLGWTSAAVFLLGKLEELVALCILLLVSLAYLRFLFPTKSSKKTDSCSLSSATIE